MKPFDHSTLNFLRDQAVYAGIAAGTYIQQQLDSDYIKEKKQGGDSLASQVVTAVDLKAQQIILDYLEDSIRRFDLGLLTEELTDDYSRLKKDYFWCIDPLDGTLPFTEGRSGYAVSIALVSKEGDPEVAVVYVPDLELCYSAVVGNGFYQNQQPFIRPLKDGQFHLFMDQSMQEEPYFQSAIAICEKWAQERNLVLRQHANFGGVRNALGVMSSDIGLYFKLPKLRNGGGSIWDYAATRLFFQEMTLPVFTASGQRLHLNDPMTTFMNKSGILYATEHGLVDLIGKLQTH